MEHQCLQLVKIFSPLQLKTFIICVLQCVIGDLLLSPFFCLYFLETAPSGFVHTFQLGTFTQLGTLLSLLLQVPSLNVSTYPPLHGCKKYLSFYPLYRVLVAIGNLHGINIICFGNLSVKQHKQSEWEISLDQGRLFAQRQLSMHGVRKIHLQSIWSLSGQCTLAQSMPISISHKYIPKNASMWSILLLFPPSLHLTFFPQILYTSFPVEHQSLQSSLMDTFDFPVLSLITWSP